MDLWSDKLCNIQLILIHKGKVIFPYRFYIGHVKLAYLIQTHKYSILFLAYVATKPYF